MIETKNYKTITKDDFEIVYQNIQKKIEKILSNALIKRKPQTLYEPGAYILSSPGKRLRPLLVLMSVKAVGGSYSDAYNAAASVEMLHNFTLVHDDIMDNADIRRGLPTVHKKYDVSTAILVGDSLLSVAYEYLLKDLKVNIKDTVATFNHGVVEVCEGQSLDKEFEVRNSVSVDEYIVMITKKTAAMAEMCCKIGAQIGNGSLEEIKALSSYGRNIGIAFQIQDDLLDVIADEKDFGKSIGGDLVEGKKTFLFIKALEKAQGKDKQALLKVVKNKGIDPKEIELYKDLYNKLGIIKIAEEEIKKYSKKAMKALNILKNPEDKEMFEILTDILLTRLK